MDPGKCIKLNEDLLRFLKNKIKPDRASIPARAPVKPTVMVQYYRKQPLIVKPGTHKERSRNYSSSRVGKLEDDDCKTVIEKECDNDYSLICNSLNLFGPAL